MCSILKMAAVSLDRSFSLLPSVFDLLLHNTDSIIDDTSLEKLLTWLSELSAQQNTFERLLLRETEAIQFLKSEEIFGSPSSTAFGLRLCGIFWRRECDFVRLRDLVKLFVSTVNNSGLWKEAAVRNAWFVGLQSLCGHREGIVWLENYQECISATVYHINDSSMFVAMAARTFTANFHIASSKLQGSPSTACFSYKVPRTHSNAESMLPGSQCNTTEPLTMLLEKLNDNSSNQIAILEIVMILLREDPKVGQDILVHSKVFHVLVKLVKTSNDIFCRKFVEVISECALKTKEWELNWEKLLCDDKDNCPAPILLEIPIILLQRGLISPAFSVIAGLAFTVETPSCFPAEWCSCLYFILDACALALQNENKQHTLASCNGDHAGLDQRSSTDLASEIILHVCSSQGLQESKELQETSSAVEGLLLPWLKDKKTSSTILKLMLNTVKELATSLDSNDSQTKVSKWTEFTLNTLRQCVQNGSSGGSFSLELYVDQKLLKICLSTLETLINVETNSQGTSAFSVFVDAVSMMLHLLRSSRAEATTIAATLKCLGNVLQFCPSHTTELLDCSAHASSGSTESPLASKRPKQDEILDKDTFASELGFALHWRLRDDRWEVKDSVFEFITFLLQTQQESVERFVADHNIPSAVWKSLDDCESYVRASAWQAMEEIMCHPYLRSHVEHTLGIKMIHALQKVNTFMQSDTEAFPRRRALECLTRWIKHRLPALSPIFTLQSSEAVSAFSRLLSCAMKDFDWEVKLRGLDLVEAIIQMFDTSKELGNWSNNPSGLSATGSHGGNQIASECFRTSDTVLVVLCKLGGVGPLLEALNDCDSLVCEKALEVLTFLRKTVEKECILDNVLEHGQSDERMELEKNTEKSLQDSKAITTLEGLDRILSTSSKAIDDFRSIIQRLDLASLSSDCACANIILRAEPACMLEDILSAAIPHDDNLLDCY